MAMSMSWLDFKLGLRMLIRYPMLTLVAGVAMAIAIGTGAGTFEIVKRAISPTLPFAEGDRIVGLSFWDRANSSQRPLTTYEFLNWRDELKTIHHLGAFRLVQRNLTVNGEMGEPVEVAEISAAAFRVTRVPALMGRTLEDADERVGSHPVVVLGYRLWQARFGGNAAVLGSIVGLGETRAVVVGIMPEGFAFPVKQSVWTPLRLEELPKEPAKGVALRVFGRLAPGFSFAQAQAELATYSSRLTGQFPEHYANLNPQVLPYVQSLMGIPPDLLVRAGIYSINTFAGLFLAVVCGNIALLMFARAAAREREILVRRALGASRSRIVAQLFTEAFVVSCFAGVVGLTATNAGLKWILTALSAQGDDWPFWAHGGLSFTTLLYSILLTLVAAILAGVVPGLKVTNRQMESGLREASAGMSGLRMGGVWTAAIVAQIALSVVFTAVAYIVHNQAAGIASAKASFPAEQYLAAQLELHEERSSVDNFEYRDSFQQRYDTMLRRLEARIAEEPQILDVTIAETLPLLPQGRTRIELDGDDEQGAIRRGRLVSSAAVELDFFRVFQTPILAGRDFLAQDATATATSVIVNQLFVDKILTSGNAIGRRLRYKTTSNQSGFETTRWFEIIGVVRNLVLDSGAPLSLDNPAMPTVYHALGSGRGQKYPLHMAMRVKGQPKSAVPTLRRIAAQVSPMLRLTSIQRLDEGTGSDAQAWRGFANAILGVSAITLVLSLAGVYAITSFTVSRRTREIAVRVALGAPVSRIITSVFGKPIAQAGAGVTFGCVMVGGLVAFWLRNADVNTLTVMKHAGLLLTYGSAMMAVCAVACCRPFLRVLRVKPSDVLRDDG